MNLIALVAAGLREHGYDGLVVPGMCGCLIGNLSPGDCISDQCEAAYKHTHSQRPEDWITSTKKDGVTDADIDRCIVECG